MASENIKTNALEASKAFVLMFSDAIRYEYQDKNIQVMTLCPGGTASKFSEVASEKSSDALKTLNQVLKDKGQLTFIFQHLI